MDWFHSVQVKDLQARACHYHRCSRYVRLCSAHIAPEASKNGSSGTLPVFGMPCKAEDAAPPKPIVVGNHRARKRQARMNSLPVMFEYACSADSNMGRVFQGLGIPHVRLAKEFMAAPEQGQTRKSIQEEAKGKGARIKRIIFQV